MTNLQIEALQTSVGAEPDGFWGRESQGKLENHLLRLMPQESPWPSPDSESLAQYYGDPGKDEVDAHLVMINVEGLGVRYEGILKNLITCHVRVANSLEKALTAVAKTESRWILSKYAGVYNKRKMRGGTKWSLHAYGAAIDLAPDTNGNGTHWPRRATMPLEVMECFARVGWMPAGAFWNRDAMHFQATRLY